ncbi:MAG: long-chain fatty acid--CoA ligase [Solirubrobacteraceae bacterium]|nr:long-chain fatty acid--CoA ligase [Solirubrobacteraceae bacterium]
MGLNLATLLDQSARRSPDAIALRLGELAISYALLDEQTKRFAAVLKDRGIEPGDRVALMLPNVPHFPIAYYGALRAGCVVVPMNVLLKGREIAFYLQDSGAKLLVAWNGFGADALAGATEAGVPMLGAGPDDPPEGVERVEGIIGSIEPLEGIHQTSPEDPAVLLYTSGTTGKPKGATLTHSNLLWNTEVNSKMFQATADDVALGALPLFHSFGQTVTMNGMLRAGATLILLPRFDPNEALDIIETQKVTLFAGVPTMYVAFLNTPKLAETDTSSLRLCISGGAAIPVEVLNTVGEKMARILEGYGLSETSPVASFNQPDQESKAGSIGTPIWGVEMDVWDEDGNAVPTGEVGEIVIRGHNVMAGYWGRPDATKDAITEHGWFKTGDMATRDEDGYYFIVDRKKDMIIRGGYNVYPREIEEVVYEHPAVLEAAIFGVPHDEFGEEIACAVVAKPGQTIDPGELQAFVKEKVAAYKYPRVIQVIGELPKGPTGKILKREIDRAAFVSGQPASA